MARPAQAPFLLSACQLSVPRVSGGATSVPAGDATPGFPVSVPDTLSPKPDLPSTGEWIDNAYVNYPAPGKVGL